MIKKGTINSKLVVFVPWLELLGQLVLTILVEIVFKIVEQKLDFDILFKIIITKKKH